MIIVLAHDDDSFTKWFSNGLLLSGCVLSREAKDDAEDTLKAKDGCRKLQHASNENQFLCFYGTRFGI